MKRLDVMIWKCLVDDIGNYVSTTEMCCALGMSRRQLLTRVTKLKFPYIERSTEAFSDGDYNEKEQYFRLQCTPYEAQQYTNHILSKYFDCPEEQITTVLNAVPIDTSITLDEVKYPDTFSMKDIIYIFNVAPCIEMTKTWSKNRYQRRDLNVQQCV